MSTRHKLRKLRSDVKSWISPNKVAALPLPSQTSGNTRISSATPDYDVDSPRVGSSNPENMSIETSQAISGIEQEQSSGSTPTVVSSSTAACDSSSWPYLRLLSKTLEQGTSSFGPLLAAIGGLIECINIFEARFVEHREYEGLRNDLEELFKVLQEGCMQNLPTNFTPMIEGLCRSIEDELAHIRGKQGRSKLRQYVEAQNDADEVLACYRRVQNHLQRVALNIDASIWRIVDEIAADSRLGRMSPSLSACYNSSKAIELKRGPCTQGTRVELLDQVIGWLNSSSSGSVYWMSGMAGTGKTTIAYSLCLQLDSTRRLAASFFCSRLLPECRDVSSIIPSIAYQLSRSSRPFRAVLSNALEKDPDVYTRLPHLQYDTLIAQPLLEVKDTLAENLVVVIDALDECENKDATSRILDVLLNRSSDLPVKFVVSSRPEPEIRGEMTKQLDPVSSRVVLHEIDGDIVRSDIEKYLRVALARIEPSDDQISTLVQRAGILFIYAATVVRYIGYNNFRGNYRTRLANVLTASSSGEKKYREIDELYTTILRAAMDDPVLEKTDIDDIRRVLHTVICAQEPLGIDTISRLLKLNDYNRVRAALQPLWSVLHVSGPNEMIATLHTSFPDYMFDSSRSGQYHCNQQIHNHTLALRCFDYFRDMRPQFNICNLESSFVSDNKVDMLGERVESAISAELYYGARYWAPHLCSANESLDLIQQLEEFLSVRLLLWMEVMNLKGCKGNMPGMIRLVENWNVNYQIALRELIHDAWRFTTTFASGAVSESTPHLYTSMIPFWPEASPIAKLYTKRAQRMISPEGTAIERQQRALLATWHFDHITWSPTFSPDGTQIAVGVEKDVLLLNASTGRMVLPPFKGHKFTVELVRFSPDGTKIASFNDFEGDNIRVWDVKNGDMMSKETAEGVITAALSSDESYISLGRYGGNLDAWDNYPTGRVSRPFSWINQQTGAIKYSPNGRVVISYDTHGNIVRDTEDGKVLNALALGQNEINDDFTSVDISPDRTRVALGAAFNSMIYIYDINTGKILLILSGTSSTAVARHSITAISYSFDGLYLASGSEDGTICIWETQYGDLVLCIPEGHTDMITSVGFSPDGSYVVSGSYDKTIRLWDTRATQATFIRSPLGGHVKPVTSVGFSPDGTRIVSAGEGHVVHVWNAESGEQIFESSPFEHNPSGSDQILATYSFDGTRIICRTDTRFVLFDAQTSDITLRLHPKRVLETPAMLSSDCSLVISLYRGSLPRRNRKPLLRISATDTDQTLMVIHPPAIASNANFVLFAVLSPDSTRIAIGLDGYNLCIIDSRSGQLLYGPYNDYPFHSSVWFSPDGTRIAQGFSLIVVREVQTGRIVLGPLEGPSSGVNSLQFSPDGNQIVCGSQDNTICVWDAQSGELVLGPVKCHTAPIKSVQFSPDGTQVVSGSQDKSIRVTDVRAKLERLPASTSPTGRDWILNTDGWVVDDQGRLLTWVPPELHAALMWPRTKLLISRGGSLRLDFSAAYLGETWVKCYQPSQA